MIARMVDRFGRWLTNRQARRYGPYRSDDTAVLVLNGQIDIVDSDSGWPGLCEVAADTDQLAAFLQACRQRGWAIFHSPLSIAEDAAQSAVTQTLHLQTLRSKGLLRRGSSGAAIADTLRAEGDIVLADRSGLNAFIGTDLQQRLRSSQRTRLIVLGGVVNADTDSTSRMAVEYDFDVTVVCDLVWAYSARDWHNSINVTLPRIVSRVLTSSQILAARAPGR